MAGIEVALGLHVPTEWLAICTKCEAGFEYKQTSPDDRPAPQGHFCPSCRNRGYQLLGILHFKEVLKS